MPIVIPKQAADIRVSSQAVADARHIGIAGDICARLRRMAKRSAPVTHRDGNRRFDDFVLLVQDGEVQAVNRF